MKIIKCVLVALVLLFSVRTSFAQNPSNFSTSSHNIRNVVAATIKGKQVLFLSNLSSEVSCYSLEGKNIWNYPLDEAAVIFEILAQDIDNDGNDDMLVASGNGTIYAIKSDGRLLWKYVSNPKVRFSEIAIVKNTTIQIFAGGNDFNLYELDTKGILVSSTKIKGVVRKIEAGNFLEDGKQSLFLMTYTHDKFRWEFMGILDPDSKAVLKEITIKNPAAKDLSKAMITDISVSDINKDGKDDVLLFGDDSRALFVGLNGNLEIIASFLGNKKEFQRYAHAKGTSLTPVKDQIMLQYGGIMYALDLKGKLIEQSGSRYGEIVFSDFAVDIASKLLIAGGEVDGGNGIYFYDISKNNWLHTTQKLQGTMVQVKENLNTLYKQALNFKLPDYQQKSDKEWVMIVGGTTNAEVEKLDGGAVKFVLQKSPKEGTDRAPLVALIGKDALKKDKRGAYDLSSEQIVKMAKDFEAEGQPFTFWAGHGNDPFYIQIETLEKILEVAPTTCYGFVYAEMDNVKDPRVIHFVNEYVPRLAAAIRKNNKAKLYFRYKNMFWALTSHLSPWKEMFFGGKYSDILVPASEDTSSRTQDINLAGRVGMLAGGYVDDFAMRLVDDNPTSWRPLTPGGQRSFSPYLRQGVLMAAYGAKYGVLINNNFTEDPGLNILYALMKSGVLPIVEKENILSIGSWHLINNVDDKLIHSVDNHHTIDQYKLDDEDAIFSQTQMHWAGTSIPSYDYSKLALGVKYRWLNYMPEMPYGMVPIAPIESGKLLDKNQIPYTISNGKKGLLDGKLIGAKDYAATFKSIVEKGASTLPIVVKGASWSAVKIDEKHTRIILIDPGYIEPQDRKVTITFQGKKPVSAIDILSNEKIEIKNNTSSVKVPAGSLRFIDVSY